MESVNPRISAWGTQFKFKKKRGVGSAYFKFKRKRGGRGGAYLITQLHRIALARKHHNLGIKIQSCSYSSHKLQTEMY